MEQQLFETFSKRFDQNDAKCDKILEALSKHVVADDKVHAVVERHATYWKFLFVGLPFLGSFIAAKMGFKS